MKPVDAPPAPAQHTSPRAVLTWVCLARSLDFMLRMGIIPFFPFLTQYYDASYGAIGTLFAAFLMGYAIFQIPCGRAADILSPARIVGLGLVVLGLSTWVFSQTDSWGLATAMRFVMGSAVAAISVPGTRLVADVYPSQQRGRAISTIEMVIGAAHIVALVMFPLIVPAIPLMHMLAGLGLACLPLAFVFMRLPSAPVSYESGDTGAFPRIQREDVRQIAALFTLGFLGMIGLNGFLSWVPTYLQEARGFSEQGAAGVMLLTLGVYIPTAYVAGSLSDRLGSRIRVVNISTVLMLASYLLLTTDPEGWLLWTVALVFGIALGHNMGPLITFATESLGRRRAGLATSLLQLAAQSGGAAVGIIFGVLVDLTGHFTSAWWLAVAALTLRVLASRLATERWQREERPES